jgi:type IV pilus assembly protein PilN
MIKINLLPQKKVKRAGIGSRVTAPRATGGAAADGQRDILIGAGAIVAAAVIVFFVVHKPIGDKRDDYETANAKLNDEIRVKSNDLKNYENLKKVVEAAEQRSESIEKLVQAKSVPANFLHELGEILTPGRLPTMSQEMATKISDGPQGDPNKRFLVDWDPKHVWITSFSEKDGVFTLKGGAQSDPDVAQLTKRLQASVYFMDVSPKGGVRVVDRESSQPYYDFTITGRVVY